MSAAKLNLKIEQGATFFRQLTWRDSRGRPVNLTGYVFHLQIRPTVESSTILLELTTANGRITTVPTQGIIKIKLTDEETLPLNWTSGVYDLLVTPPSGDAFRMLEGTVKVSPAVTRVV